MRGGGERRGPWEAWLPLAFAVAWYAHGAARFIDASCVTVGARRYYVLFDDAMISMRYARNLVDHGELAWNVGERVEGVTNLAWLAPMALLSAVFDRSPAALGMQVLGAVLLAGAGLAWGWLGARLAGVRTAWGRSLVWAAVFAVAVGGFPARFWSLSGMEVSALVALAGACLALGVGPLSAPSLRASGALAALAFALRPDGLLVVAPALGLVVWRLRPAPRRLLQAAWPLLAGVAAVTAFRLAYFGDVVPNTYRLKIDGVPLDARWRNGALFVWPYLQSAWALHGLALASVLSLRRAPLVALWALPTGLLAYQVHVGGDPWPYWRQLTPGLPALVVLVVVGGAEALRRAARAVGANEAVCAAGGALGAGVVALALSGAIDRVAQSTDPEGYNHAWAQTNVRRALLLERYTERDARVAVIWAGTTMYYLDRPGIDLLGKSDRHVAAQAPMLDAEVAFAGMNSVPGHNKTDLRHSIVGLEADYTETFSWGRDAVPEEVRGRFEAVRLGGLTLHLRRDSPRVRWEAVRRAQREGSGRW